MDIRENIIGFLDNSGFDDFTKIRYVYLYVCNMFSYDVRFMYGSYDLRKKIYNKKVDITNVQEYEFACYTYAHILVDILSLLNIHAEIVRDSDYEFQHAYVIVKHKGKVLKLDPTKKHDTTRVKMGNMTLDFETLIDDPVFADELIYADKQISEKTEHKLDFSILYNNDTIMQLLKIINENAEKRNLSKTELFFEKLDTIFCLINTRKDFTRYDDIDYYFSYLLKKFQINEEEIHVRPAIFFKNDDETMRNIINIILVEYNGLPPFFYILEKVNGNYKVREMDLKEAEEKLDEYSNVGIDYFYRNKLNKIKGNFK